MQNDSGRPAVQTPGSLWLMAAWFGVAGGLLEVAIVSTRKLWFTTTLVVSPQLVWMIPVDTVVLALGLAGALAVARYLVPRLRSLPSVVLLFPFAFLAVLGPLLAVPRLHIVAVLVLAAGCAMQAARVLESRPHLFPRSLWWMCALAGLLAVGVNARLFAEERRAMAALPTAAAQAPNVMLVVLDTVRAKSLSLYGYERATSPELVRIAGAGAVFESAMSTSPWTLPSHASMFTGRWPHELTSGWRTALDSTYPTLAESLQAKGYVTGGFVSNLIYGSRAHGLDRGFLHYQDVPVSIGQAILSSSVGSLVATVGRLRRWIGYQRVLNRKTGTQVTDDVLSWVAQRGDRPYFAFANYMDSHEPYLPPAPFDAKFGPRLRYGTLAHSPVDAFRPAKWSLSKAEVQAEQDAYDASIAYLDHEVGRLVDGLRAQGALDNTLLIIVGDHGEQFGEHRLFGHGNSLYRPLIEVPLVLVFPGRVPAGVRLTEPVSLRDLPATVLDLLGVREQTPFPGQSLAGCWRDDGTRGCGGVLLSEASQRVFGAVQPWYPLSHGDMQSIVADGYHYIRNTTGAEELYELSTDSDEQTDLSGSQDRRGVLDRMRALLRERHPSAASQE